MGKVAAFAAALFVAAVTTGPAQAQSGIKVGLLTCHIDGGTGFILGSTKSADCMFNPSHRQWRREHYAASMSRFGIDIGMTEGATLVWAVFAPGRVSRGSLAGGYVGAGAEVTIGVGLGANVLVGGFQHSINLQPLSIQGQTGINVAGGIGALTLRKRK